MWIEPKGFEEIHSRGNTEAHRLQDPSKWVPFGVGAIEGQAGAPLRVLEPGDSPRRGCEGIRPGRGAPSARGRADRGGRGRGGGAVRGPASAHLCEGGGGGVSGGGGEGDPGGGVTHYPPAIHATDGGNRS